MAGSRRQVSLESLVESGDLKIEVLHPGGLETTRELAELCRIGAGSKVLDVASGTGETACYLAESLGCEVTGIDVSPPMVERARRKAGERGVRATFDTGDAHALPFEDGAFDAVISECTMCLLDKEKALAEMVRVAKSGGYAGIHDLCWKGDPPQQMKEKLAEIENESPETLDGWRRLFEGAGLADVVTVDKSHLVADWMKSSRRELGAAGVAKLIVKVATSSGVGGLRRLWQSERIFESEHMGYGIIVGRKP
jgi:ubiquinone/menaquinone biosynthesis C-methylase UbiE